MDEIEIWLNRIGFTQYIPGFIGNGIDGDLLKHLTNDDLGISRLGDRKKIFFAIESLNREKNLSVNEQETVYPAHSSPHEARLVMFSNGTTPTGAAG